MDFESALADLDDLRVWILTTGTKPLDVYEKIVPA